jgi:hypothetical protein
MDNDVPSNNANARAKRLMFLAERIRELYRLTGELSAEFGRSFRLDGHAVGSIGEVYAHEAYGIELHKQSHAEVDGWITLNGRQMQVQIKATARTKGAAVNLTGPSDQLLVFMINENGEVATVYNGDGLRPWNYLVNKGRKVTRGCISISLWQLEELQSAVPESSSIPLVT